MFWTVGSTSKYPTVQIKNSRISNFLKELEGSRSERKPRKDEEKTYERRKKEGE
jgi:hypothetical protein